MSAYAKAIVAFIFTALANLAANWANSGTPAPQTAAEWLTAIISTVVTTFAVYQWPNTPPTVVVNRTTGTRTT